MRTLNKLVPFLVLVFCFSFVNAQEEMTAKKLDNPQFYYITLVKFEDGKMKDAKKIINEHFIPTDQESGHQGPIAEMDLLFSEWDQIVIFPMEEGLEGLEWEMSPRNVEWMTTLHKRVGGPEKAKQIMDEFESYIKDYKTILARTTGTRQ
jgi:hypothetical protein